MRKTNAVLVAMMFMLFSSMAMAQMGGLDQAESIMADVETWVYKIFPSVAGLAVAVAALAYLFTPMGKQWLMRIAGACIIVGAGPGLVYFLTGGL